MSFKRKAFNFLKGCLKDGGIGLALLGAGTLLFQNNEVVSNLVLAVLFLVLGFLSVAIAFVMDLFEDLIFKE